MTRGYPRGVSPKPLEPVACNLATFPSTPSTEYQTQALLLFAFARQVRRARTPADPLSLSCGNARQDNNVTRCPAAEMPFDASAFPSRAPRVFETRPVPLLRPPRHPVLVAPSDERVQRFDRERTDPSDRESESSRTKNIAALAGGERPPVNPKTNATSASSR